MQLVEVFLWGGVFSYNLVVKGRKLRKEMCLHLKL